jgi:hypothetical protein
VRPLAGGLQAWRALDFPTEDIGVPSTLREI